MVDMMDASRQYQNNVEVVTTLKALTLKTINLENKRIKMSEISSNQSLNKILDQLGINKSKEKFAPREVKDQLGQRFLKLMTVQLQNQDPFAPVDNADFIAQMAQFSTVTGITKWVKPWRMWMINYQNWELLQQPN